MKKYVNLILLLAFLLPVQFVSAAQTLIQEGGGAGVSLSTNCDQAQYYALGTLCQDSTSGRLYKGTGAAVVEILSGAANGTGDVLGPGSNHSGYVPTWGAQNSKTLTDGLPYGQSGANTLLQTDSSGNLPTISAAGANFQVLGGGNTIIKKLDATASSLGAANAESITSRTTISAGNIIANSTFYGAAVNTASGNITTFSGTNATISRDLSAANLKISGGANIELVNLGTANAMDISAQNAIVTKGLAGANVNATNAYFTNTSSTNATLSRDLSAANIKATTQAIITSASVNNLSASNSVFTTLSVSGATNLLGATNIIEAAAANFYAGKAAVNNFSATNNVSGTLSVSGAANLLGATNIVALAALNMTAPIANFGANNMSTAASNTYVKNLVAANDILAGGSANINNIAAQNGTLQNAVIAGGSASNLVTTSTAYGVSWDGDMNVPTKKDLYDKIQTMAGGFDPTEPGTIGGTTPGAFNGTIADFSAGNLRVDAGGNTTIKMLNVAAENVTSGDYGSANVRDLSATNADLGATNTTALSATNSVVTNDSSSANLGVSDTATVNGLLSTTYSLGGGNLIGDAAGNVNILKLLNVAASNIAMDAAGNVNIAQLLNVAGSNISMDSAGNVKIAKGLAALNLTVSGAGNISDLAATNYSLGGGNVTQDSAGNIKISKGFAAVNQTISGAGNIHDLAAPNYVLGAGNVTQDSAGNVKIVRGLAATNLTISAASNLGEVAASNLVAPIVNFGGGNFMVQADGTVTAPNMAAGNAAQLLGSTWEDMITTTVIGSTNMAAGMNVVDLSAVNIALASGNFAVDSAGNMKVGYIEYVKQTDVPGQVKLFSDEGDETTGAGFWGPKGSVPADFYFGIPNAPPASANSIIVYATMGADNVADPHYEVIGGSAANRIVQLTSAASLGALNGESLAAVNATKLLGQNWDDPGMIGNTTPAGANHTFINASSNIVVERLHVSGAANILGTLYVGGAVNILGAMNAASNVQISGGINAPTFDFAAGNIKTGAGGNLLIAKSLIASIGIGGANGRINDFTSTETAATNGFAGANITLIGGGNVGGAFRVGFIAAPNFNLGDANLTIDGGGNIGIAKTLRISGALNSVAGGNLFMNNVGDFTAARNLTISRALAATNGLFTSVSATNGIVTELAASNGVSAANVIASANVQAGGEVGAAGNIIGGRSINVGAGNQVMDATGNFTFAKDIVVGGALNNVGAGNIKMNNVGDISAARNVAVTRALSAANVIASIFVQSVEVAASNGLAGSNLTISGSGNSLNHTGFFTLSGGNLRTVDASANLYTPRSFQAGGNIIAGGAVNGATVGGVEIAAVNGLAGANLTLNGKSMVQSAGNFSLAAGNFRVVDAAGNIYTPRSFFAGGNVDATGSVTGGSIAASNYNFGAGNLKQLDAAGNIYTPRSFYAAGNVDIGAAANSGSVSTGAINATSAVILGSLAAYVPIEVNGAGNFVLGGSAANKNMLGGMTTYSASGAINLPSAVRGMSGCVYLGASAAANVDPNAGEFIILDGAALNAGYSIKNTAGAGTFICLVAAATNEWTTLGKAGTWATNGQ